LGQPQEQVEERAVEMKAMMERAFDMDELLP
jgi:hypothetical protein